MNENYCSIIQIDILSISMHIQNLNEIHKLIHKILSINKILTSIKGHYSVKNCPKIMALQDGSCIYQCIYTILSKFIHFFLKTLRKKTFLHKSGAITLLFINKFSPFAIPNHSSPIPMSMQSLKKISQKLLKLESGNKVLTDTQNSSEGITQYAATFLRRGIITQGYKFVQLLKSCGPWITPRSHAAKA